MIEDLLIHGKYVVTGAEHQVLQDAAVLVRDGRIEAVGLWSDLRSQHPETRVLGDGSAAVIPGLINAHHHSAGATALQHGIADDLLEPWILAHVGMRDSDFGQRVLLSAARLLRSGVTSVVEVTSCGGPLERFTEHLSKGLTAYDQSGLRVAFAAGFTSRSHLVHGAGEDERFLAGLPEPLSKQVRALLADDAQVPTSDEYFSVMREMWQQTRDHPRFDLWFGPPGPQWVSDALLERLAGEAADMDTGIQTHACESYLEKLHGERAYGRETLFHLDRLGLLSPRFSIAHGVWFSDAEIDLLADRGGAVSHNPSSNLRLRAGIAPLNRFLEAGVTTALGMDGTTINDDEDFFAEMRLALRLNRSPQLGANSPSPRDIFAMATGAGARLLRKDTTLGQITKGYQADMALVDLDRACWPWVAPEADPLELIVQRAQAGDVTDVLIAGEIVLRDREPTRFDLESVAATLAEKLVRQGDRQDKAQTMAALTPYLEAYYASWARSPLSPRIDYNSAC